VGAEGWVWPAGAAGGPWPTGSADANEMHVIGAIVTVRRSCVRFSRRLYLMSVALALGSRSSISSMSATLSVAGAERVASILRRSTSVSSSFGPFVLSAARSSLLSTSTDCSHNSPLSVLGHQRRLTRILATEAPLHTLFTIAGTRVLISVSGLLDPDKNSITTFLVAWLGITGSGAVAVSGQVFAEGRLRPPVGAALDLISSSMSVAELLLPASSSVAASSLPVRLPTAPSGSSDKADSGGAAGGAPPAEGAPVAGGVLEAVRLDAEGGSPRGRDFLNDWLLARATQGFASSNVVEPESMRSALSM